MRAKPGSTSAIGTSSPDFSAICCSICLVRARASASVGDSSRTFFTSRSFHQVMTSAESYSFDMPRVLRTSIGMPSFCHCHSVTSVTPMISASSV